MWKNYDRVGVRSKSRNSDPHQSCDLRLSDDYDRLVQNGYNSTSSDLKPKKKKKKIPEGKKLDQNSHLDEMTRIFERFKITVSI